MKPSKAPAPWAFIAAIYCLLMTVYCAPPDTFNPGDPTTNEYLEYTIARCLFFNGCPGEDDTPRVASTLPADGQTSVGVGTSIQVTFNRSVSPGGVSSNGGAGGCTGTIQISTDDFASCIPLINITAGANNQTFTITPSSSLIGSAVHKLRVTSGITDLAGEAVAEFTQATGFATNAGLMMYVTTAQQTGALDADASGSGIDDADSICGTDPGNPYPQSSWKALLVTGGVRVASTSGNAGDNQVDWVLKSSTPYYRPDGATLVWTTNANAIFIYGTLAAQLQTAATVFWTGIQSNWVTAAQTCVGFTTTGSNGGVGTANATDLNFTNTTSQACTSPLSLLCVEQ